MEKKYFDAPFKDPINVEVFEEVGEPWETMKQELISEQEQDRELKISKFLELYKSRPRRSKMEGSQRWRQVGEARAPDKVPPSWLLGSGSCSHRYEELS